MIAPTAYNCLVLFLSTINNINLALITVAEL